MRRRRRGDAKEKKEERKRQGVGGGGQVKSAWRKKPRVKEKVGKWEKERRKMGEGKEAASLRAIRGWNRLV